MLPLPRKLSVPWYHWCLGVCAVCFWLVGSVAFLTLLGKARLPEILIAFFLAGIWIFGQALKPLMSFIKMRHMVLYENGIEVELRGRKTFLGWQDVVRYEPHRWDFVLFFKGGRVIRILSHARDFPEIQHYVLDQIEKIGTFEDGRKVPRVLVSISLKAFFWLLGIIGLTLIVLIVFRR